MTFQRSVLYSLSGSCPKYLQLNQVEQLVHQALCIFRDRLPNAVVMITRLRALYMLI